MRTRDLHLWHPFTNEGTDPAPLQIRRAHGVYLETQDGRQILDAISSWWVNLHGHSHPAIAEAIAKQAAQMEHVLFAGFTHGPAEELAARLGKIVPPALRHIFFSDDGSTAVEVALKLAVQFWSNSGRPEKIAHRCARRRLPWRHTRCHVGERGLTLHRGIQRPESSCVADALRKLCTLPRRPHSGNLQH